MTCPDCGSPMIGDAYTVVLGCEAAADSFYWDKEPDATPVHCTHGDSNEATRAAETS